VAILAVSASVALAAERLTSVQQRPVSAGVAGGASLSDIAGFVSRVGYDSALPEFRIPVRVDPFNRFRGPADQFAVASEAGVPTLPSSSAAAGGRRLTAILVADERRVAVIDDETVSVGDVLRDGARVSAIQPDRVFVVEKNGRWRTLTLTNRGL
jgi:hypothetical protein